MTDRLRVWDAVVDALRRLYEAAPADVVDGVLGDVLRAVAEADGRPAPLVESRTLSW